MPTSSRRKSGRDRALATCRPIRPRSTYRIPPSALRISHPVFIEWQYPVLGTACESDSPVCMVVLTNVDYWPVSLYWGPLHTTRLGYI